MQNSHIEWTDDTYNPIKKKGGGFYCFKVSPACTNCYAEVMARRTAAMQGGEFKPYANMKKYPELELRRDMIKGWSQKKRPRKCFVSSMTDIFGEFVPDEWVFEILDGMLAAPLQTFQMLTKRAERSYHLIMAWLKLRGLSQLPANMWIGLSVEDQIRAEERIPWLVKIPAVVRFLSCEPLLGLLDISYWLKDNLIQWVICGGESGNKKTIRPMHPEWPIALRDQCLLNSTPFFFKQWGQYGTIYSINSVPYFAEFRSFQHWVNKATTWVRGGICLDKHGKQLKIGADFMEADRLNNFPVTIMHKLGKKKSGALLDGVEYKQFPKI